jgi:hypothetical protein
MRNSSGNCRTAELLSVLRYFLLDLADDFQKVFEEGRGFRPSSSSHSEAIRYLLKSTALFCLNQMEDTRNCKTATPYKGRWRFYRVFTEDAKPENRPSAW